MGYYGQYNAQKLQSITRSYCTVLTLLAIMEADLVMSIGSGRELEPTISISDISETIVGVGRDGLDEQACDKI